ncbi:cysteine hydrolase family protein [Coralloluteibacterium thermophilus]|uniref:Cysteine hydrolase family protein n=1 Tax=Coralloluteibacterium thermophilum TaxID=2707049 RepID=A0ABV9NNI9_9GAMM
MSTAPLRTALVVIDMISDYDFPRGEALARRALPAARAIARLKARLGRQGVPTIYANDNYGRWRSDFRQTIEAAAASPHGAPIVEMLRPGPEDYFVLKPRHSAFFGSPLDMLLEDLDAKRLILTGVAGDRCVMATAADAHMRRYTVFVPRDCMASETAARQTRALQHLEGALQADIRPSTALTPRRLRAA